MRTLIVLCALLSVPLAGHAQSQSAQQSILEDELAAEAAGYADAYSELKSARKAETSVQKLEDIAERVNRHRRNMAELAREIARAEGDLPASGRLPKAASAQDNWFIAAHPAQVGAAPKLSAPTVAVPGWLVPGAEDIRR